MPQSGDRICRFASCRATGTIFSMERWHVYILQCADRTLYTGIATDIAARVATHNAGRGAKYTRGRLPAALVYQEPADDRGAALRREREIKRMSVEAKRRLIASQDA